MLIQARRTLDAGVPAMPVYLFIIARDQPELFTYVSHALADTEEIRVILDRRFGERRKVDRPSVPERRQAERRTRRHVDEQLAFIGYAIVEAQ